MLIVRAVEKSSASINITIEWDVNAGAKTNAQVDAQGTTSCVGTLVFHENILF